MMIRYLAALLLLLSLTALVSADGCYRGSRSYSYSYPTYSYSAPTYSAPYVAPYVAPAKPVEYQIYRYLLAFPLVELPSYGAVYQPPVAPTLPQQQSPKGSAQGLPPTAFEEAVLKKLDELGKGLREVSERVDRIERTRTPQQLPPPKQELPKQPPEQGPAPDVEKAFFKVNQESCIMCHARSVADVKGGKFVFTEDDGTPVQLSAEQREEVQRQLIAETMPMKGTPKDNVKKLDKDTRSVLFNELDRQIRNAGKRSVSKK